jgi:hypothetical protein
LQDFSALQLERADEGLDAAVDRVSRDSRVMGNDEDAPLAWVIEVLLNLFLCVVRRLEKLKELSDRSDRPKCAMREASGKGTVAVSREAP